MQGRFHCALCYTIPICTPHAFPFLSNGTKLHHCLSFLIINYGWQRKTPEQAETHTDARGRRARGRRALAAGPWRPSERRAPVYTTLVGSCFRLAWTCCQPVQRHLHPHGCPAGLGGRSRRTQPAGRLTRRLGPGGSPRSRPSSPEAAGALGTGQAPTRGAARREEDTAAPTGRRRPTAAGADAGPGGQGAAGLCHRPGPAPARHPPEPGRDSGGGRRPPAGGPHPPHPRVRRRLTFRATAARNPPGSELPAPLPLPTGRAGPGGVSAHEPRPPAETFVTPPTRPACGLTAGGRVRRSVPARPPAPASPVAAPPSPLRTASSDSLHPRCLARPLRCPR